MMKLLVSPKDKEEALEAIGGGADIIDVKNPAEGSLGANFPWVISGSRDLLPEGAELSATVGDFPNLPGTASLAVLGVASLGVNYVKIGLYGVSSIDDSVKLASSAVRAVKDTYPETKVVIAGYADYKRINSVSAESIPSIAGESHADIAMLDTAVKDGTNLFSFMNISELEKFVHNAHDFNIMAAFGGSLAKEHILPLFNMGLDIVGIRGAVCQNSDRINGKIKTELVRDLKNLIENYS